MRIDLDAYGVEESSGLFSGLGDRMGDPRPVWRGLVQQLMAWQRQRFSRQPWTPLDADTVRQKGGDARILHASGALERALTIWKAPGQKLDIDLDGFVFGLTERGDAYYGRFHQYGDGVPRRTVLDVPPFFARRAADALLRHLLGRL